MNAIAPTLIQKLQLLKRHRIKFQRGDEMKSKIAILLLSLASTAVWAAGAPWFKWMSTSDRTIICNQLSPGEGWVKYQGPFMDSQCRKPGTPQ